MEPIRIFIGTEPKTEIARKVLEFSIKRRTILPVEFTPMIGKDWEYDISGIPVGTGFSLRRWMIPEYCDWTGRAIYMDADQLVFGDVGELWEVANSLTGKTDLSSPSAYMSYQPDKFSKAPWPQSSVMVVDCDRAGMGDDCWGWQIRKILDYLRKNPTKDAYAKFMHGTWMRPHPGRFGNEWNALNVYEKGKTKLLHYTNETTGQPWYRPNVQFADLWKSEFKRAVAAGEISRIEIEQALSNWGKKVDWRPNNGLAPEYREYLALCPS